MKKIFKYLFLATVVCGVTSCQDFLSPEPTANLTTQYFYQNDEQVEAALTAVYVPLRTAAFLGSTYTLNFHGFSDEDMHYNANSDRVNNFSQTATNSTVQAFWTQGYAGLKNIAYLLEGMETNKDNLSESMYKKARGEALFLRGFYHFTLCQWFCYPTTGIPMLLNTITTYEEASMPLATLDEHFLQIEADMKEAEELLTDIGQTWSSLGYSERVTVTAVQGMLARVALHAAGFPNYGGSMGTEYYYRLAMEYADLVIASGQHSLEDEYSAPFIAQAADQYVSENIWEIGYQYLGSGNSDYNTAGAVGSQFGLQRNFQYLTASGSNAIGDTLYDSLYLGSVVRYMHPRLLVSYGQVGDDRRTWNHANFFYEQNTGIKVPKVIIDGSGYVTEMRGSASSNTTAPLYEYTVAYMWGATIGKWRREYEDRSIERDGTSTGTNYPLLRYPDVLLMAAEARIELNEEMSTAVSYIQQIRSRSIKNPSTYMITHVVLDDTGAMNRGWTYVPEIEVVNPGSGTGFEIRCECDHWANSQQGRLTVGVLNPGTGYDTPPTLRVKTPRMVTWQPNTAYAAGDFVTASAQASTATATTMRVYRAYTSGTSTDVYPTHTTAATSDTTIADAELTGVEWLYESGTYTTEANGAYAPAIRAICGKSVDPSVTAHVASTSDQEAMREFLRDERSRELCFESLRRLDLRRWGILYETVASNSAYYDGGDGIIPVTVNVSAASSGTGAMITAGSYATYNNVNYLPIPQTQLTLNRNLIQNPGY